MFSLTSSMRYYLYSGITDMRKGFDGLGGLVDSELGRNPTSGEVFIFINRRRNALKLLHWEDGGFVLYYKRLEAGTLSLPPAIPGAKSCYVTWTQLVLMVQGIKLENMVQKKRFSR